MDNRIERVYVPMTETGFYILYCLQTPQHGYGMRGDDVRHAFEDGKGRADRL